jgi:uncharacterized protein (UPF0332 family)
MEGTREDYINYRVSKSKEIFSDAEYLASDNRWNSCVNRLYYSSYYLVSALLYLNNIKTDTHNGVRTQFFMNFVKTGKIDTEAGKLYSNLFRWRQESDYADFKDFDQETVEPLIEETRILNQKVLDLF